MAFLLGIGERYTPWLGYQLGLVSVPLLGAGQLKSILERQHSAGPPAARSRLLKQDQAVLTHQDHSQVIRHLATLLIHLQKVLRQVLVEVLWHIFIRYAILCMSH